MSKLETNLVGAIVEIEFPAGATVVLRGEVRAVTECDGGALRLWVEELPELERAYWFSRRGPNRDEDPGRVLPMALGDNSDSGRGPRLRVLRAPQGGSDGRAK